MTLVRQTAWRSDRKNRQLSARRCGGGTGGAPSCAMLLLAASVMRWSRAAQHQSRLQGVAELSRPKVGEAHFRRNLSPLFPASDGRAAMVVTSTLNFQCYRHPVCVHLGIALHVQSAGRRSPRRKSGLGQLTSTQRYSDRSDARRTSRPFDLSSPPTPPHFFLPRLEEQRVSPRRSVIAGYFSRWECVDVCRLSSCLLAMTDDAMMDKESIGRWQVQSEV